MKAKELLLIFSQKSNGVTNQMMERIIAQMREQHSEDPSVDNICEFVRQMTPLVLYAYKQGGFDFARLITEKGGETTKSDITSN